MNLKNVTFNSKSNHTQKLTLNVKGPKEVLSSDFDENPDVEGHDHEKIEPTKEHNKLAERRVRLGLLLAELGQKAEVEVTEAEMTQAIMEQARQYPGQERQFFEFIQKNEQMQQQIRAPLFEDKVVDYVFEQASVTEKEVTKNVLQKAVESLEEE